MTALTDKIELTAKLVKIGHSKFAKATHGKGFGGSPETDRPKLRANTKTSGILSKGKKTGLKGKNILLSTPLPFATIKAEINMICAR